jgi:Kef-type K+ transport system membrane component KefB
MKSCLIPKHYYLLGMVIGAIVGYKEYRNSMVQNGDILSCIFFIFIGMSIGLIMAWLTSWRYS